MEAAALAESWSKHPISLSIKAAYGKPIDAARVTDVQELGGHGVTAKVDGKAVAAGNARLMKKLGLTVPAVDGVGTICLLYTSSIHKNIRRGILRTIE